MEVVEGVTERSYLHGGIDEAKPNSRRDAETQRGSVPRSRRMYANQWVSVREWVR